MLNRKSESDVRTWRIPMLRGKYVMLDITWGRLGYLCDGFGYIDGIIQCLDTPGLMNYRWGLNEFRWDKDGNNLGSWTQEFIAVEGEVTAIYFIIGRSY